MTQARSALLRKKPTLALKALETHRMEFPEGQLREERQAIEVHALRQAGRSDEAERRAKAFAQAYPNSIFLDWVSAK